MRQGAEIRFTFFGHVESGRLEFGVLQTSSGFAAGRFVNGIAQPTDERMVYIEAFRVASNAARDLSERFRKIGNMASSRAYADMAKLLANQMD